MYVLDTNVVSELRKAKDGRADKHVTAWAIGVLPSSLFVSVITTLELELGVLLVERRDPVRGGVLRAWLDHRVLPDFADRVLPIDTEVARRCARLHVPNPQGERDALIAATALLHGMTVLTRDATELGRTGVQVINPWLDEGSDDPQSG
jgi:predicted nucleic acid-binding protein